MTVPAIRVRRSPDGKRVAVDARTLPDADFPGPMPDHVKPWIEVHVRHGLTVQLLDDEEVSGWVES